MDTVERTLRHLTSPSSLWWLRYHMRVETCGRVDVWTCGRVDVWTCGRVDVWTCGRVAVWPCRRQKQCRRSLLTSTRLHVYTPTRPSPRLHTQVHLYTPTANVSH